MEKEVGEATVLGEVGGEPIEHVAGRLEPPHRDAATAEFHDQTPRTSILSGDVLDENVGCAADGQGVVADR